MARKIHDIYKEIIDEKNSLALIKDALAPTSAQAETLELLLAELNSRSRVAIWRLWAFITAVGIFIAEKFREIFLADAKKLVYESGIGNPTWLRAKVLEFQFDEVAPQNLQLNSSSLALSYPVVDPTKRVITRCSVTSEQAHTRVLVAMSEPPEEVSPTILAVLRYYIGRFNFCSREITVVSNDADELYIKGEVRVNPFFATVAPLRVYAAIEEYCKMLSSAENFGGDVVVSEVRDVIRAVEGIEDFKLEELSIRPAMLPFSSRTKIYKLDEGINIFKSLTFSGYIVPETTAGYTYEDQLTF